MKVVLKTEVAGYYKDVMARFDKDLFEALAPKLAKVEVEKFTGSKKGDEVHLRFISPIKVTWISHIIDDGIDEEKAFFIDKGIVLPFPLATWEHHHLVEHIDNKRCRIVDDMRFTGKNFLLTLILYPAIYMGFLPRKSIYRKYFGKPNKS